LPKPETLSAIEIAREYFTRMRARDLGLVLMFLVDAVLIGLGGEVAQPFSTSIGASSEEPDPRPV
jgi:hypothetical protein